MSMPTAFLVAPNGKQCDKLGVAINFDKMQLPEGYIISWQMVTVFDKREAIPPNSTLIQIRTAYVFFDVCGAAATIRVEAASINDLKMAIKYVCGLSTGAAHLPHMQAACQSFYHGLRNDVIWLASWVKSHFAKLKLNMKLRF